VSNRISHPYKWQTFMIINGYLRTCSLEIRGLILWLQFSKRTQIRVRASNVLKHQIHNAIKDHKICLFIQF
jgi:hypothetical protein